MSLDIEVINSLKSLPCFGEIQTIDCLTNGLSQTAIKVTTASQTFFAKKLHHDTAITEAYCALTCSTENREQDSKQHLSPDVIYHDQEWLVTAFIQGMTLAESSLEVEKKILTALALMTKLHQLPVSGSKQAIPLLDATQSTKRLLTKPARFLVPQSPILDKVTKCLTLIITRLSEASTSANVLCHGDMNFTNILVDDNRHPWLIDFECAHIAPVEFDLAMFIAVNNLPTQHLNEIVENYIKLSPEYCCNHELLIHYILYSFFINGLWYFDNITCDSKDSDERNQKLYYRLAIEQWSAFDNFAIECAIEIPKLIPLIS